MRQLVRLIISRKGLVAAWALLLSLHAYSQSGTLTGVVTDEQGNTLSGASVTLSDEVSSQITDQSGRFTFSNLPTGSYTLRITHVGYTKYTEQIRFSGRKSELTIQLSPQSTILEDVTVVGKSETQQVREQAIRAVVVDTRSVAEQPTTLAELMNRSPGIRIRQSGGLGNAVDVSINGFQGNAVQYFRDGIPLEYLGGGYGINNVPINLLERAEVYKGVVPVSLGGDALGGAVNLVTRKHFGTMLDISYEAASFNTHIANLSAYHQASSGWFGGIDAFYNYSDNDYKADVEVVNENANLVPATVPLFHNGYSHYFLEAYAGVRNTNWTDELQFSLAHYGVDRESQHPALMTTPYGALTMHNTGWVPSIRYRKGFSNFALDQFVSYSAINRARVDTVGGTYNWHGDFTPHNGVGESPRPSLSAIDFDNLISRTNVAYGISESHKLDVNVIFNHNKRIGTDPYGLRFAGTDIDILSKEASYAKTIAGISWESKWLSERLVNQLTAKFFHFKTRGINGFMANATDLNDYTTSEKSNWGIGNAIKYTIGDHHLLRASFELTNRLPRENELFGDNDTRAPNFDLEPERSFNISLGYRYQAPQLSAEIGTFYRKTKGMIMLIPVQPPFAQYQNLDSIRGYGVDIDINYQIGQVVQLNANATWQDNRMVDIGDGLHQWIEGTRLRNTPYFFTNAGAVVNFTDILSASDRLKPYVYWNFIREFYLNHIPRDAEPDGFLGLFGKAKVPVTNVVPNQHLLSAGFNYFLASQPVSIGLEVKNVADSKLYDYYKIQRPGRSFHVKINYHLTKKR
ncbi:MAG TPA: TonB-dependent receptor [Parapedobacter sp.]|uniref:TonB-dependent receptor n=1 Tax=Parapedobacter sp. TaxID=1958893 RepID=UPI002C732811|nr:TonB-dependent receptor [Parapedobacter sp.]HWK57852.1 TonB-dependent receptor [Parapedobacter sp.]